MVKKFICIAGCCFLVVGLAGCRTVKQKSAPSVELPVYSGPRAKISVADFQMKAAKAGQEAGQSMREMFLATLENTKRFNIVELKGEAGSADLIINASIIDFEPPASGGRVGVGGGGGISNGVLGSLLGTSLNKAHIALNISIMDAATLKVLAATQVQGQAADNNMGLIREATGSLGSGLSDYANTLTEKAIRICVLEAARYVSSDIPESYYKY
jgi:curli biogenesis system outer membrane secretion channel CsgG